jgi:hypothetical protein
VVQTERDFSIPLALRATLGLIGVPPPEIERLNRVAIVIRNRARTEAVLYQNTFFLLLGELAAAQVISNHLQSDPDTNFKAIEVLSEMFRDVNLTTTAPLSP